MTVTQVDRWTLGSSVTTVETRERDIITIHQESGARLGWSMENDVVLSRVEWERIGRAMGWL